MSSAEPPRLTTRLLALLLPGRVFEAVAGDLEEEFRERLRHTSPRRAGAWYRRQAIRSIVTCWRGSRPAVRTSPRDRGGPLQDLSLDVRFALRSFTRNPGLVVLVTLTLALGIGATTAIFTVLDATLLRPLPYSEPERLVAVYEENDARGWTWNQASPANFLSWRERSTTLEDITAHGFRVGWAFAGPDDRAEWLDGATVFHNFFEVMGARPVLGRGFVDDEVWGGARVVVISHGLWQRAFGGDPEVVGQIIALDEIEREIVGVAPPGFAFPDTGIDVWAPFRWSRENVEAAWFRRAHFIWPVGRLAHGVDESTAHAEIQTIAAGLQAEYPETNESMSAGVVSLQRWVVGDTRRPLLILGLAVSAVLLVACANIANLLLARATGRRQELAVRSALGAGRARLVRQLLTESVCLAALGGAAGVGVAALMTRGLVLLAGEAIPPTSPVTMDARVMGFALFITLATGLGFGLFPSLQLGWARLSEVMNESSRSGSADPRPARARNLLVVAEVALAVVLVAGAGLMLRSLDALYAVDPGFSLDNLVTAEFELPGSRYGDQVAVETFFDELVDRLVATPGVVGVSATDTLALEGTRWTSDLFIDGRPPADTPYIFNRRIVDHRYFTTLGVPVLRGRSFTAADGPDTPDVIIINETLAGQVFPGEDPVGERIRFGDDDDDPWLTVVGVVGSERVEGLDANPWGEIYLTTRQEPIWYLNLLVRGAAGGQAEAAVQRELAALDPLVPIIRFRPFEEIVSGSLSMERLLTTLLTAFAAVALLLAAMGLYGVLAYSVAQRTREIGIRVALGARGDDVLRIVVKRALVLVVTGGALGAAAYGAVASTFRALLFEVSPGDPLTLGGVLLVMLATGFAAAYLPARRATRVDPVEALRSE